MVLPHPRQLLCCQRCVPCLQGGPLLCPSKPRGAPGVRAAPARLDRRVGVSDWEPGSDRRSEKGPPLSSCPLSAESPLLMATCAVLAPCSPHTTHPHTCDHMHTHEHMCAHTCVHEQDPSHMCSHTHKHNAHVCTLTCVRSGDTLGQSAGVPACLRPGSPSFCWAMHASQRDRSSSAGQPGHSEPRQHHTGTGTRVLRPSQLPSLKERV